MNGNNIKLAMEHLRYILRTRFQVHFGQETNGKDNPSNMLELLSDSSAFYNYVKTQQLTWEEYIVLILTLAPHIQPDIFSKTVQEFLPEGGDFPEFGGVKGLNHRGFLPTGETAAFILASDDYEKRFAIQKIFSDDHFFYRQNVLRIEEAPEGEPMLSGRLAMSREYIELFTSGDEYRPKFTTNFPAKRIYTQMTWEDLVLNQQTIQQIEDIKNWTLYHQQFLDDWQMRKKVKPGYRALFYGPPGTGKTLTAGLLGKYTERDVYKIDLSMIVSKYIGETEKNLSKIFDQAEHRHWIIFFDEADSIFGKRTGVQSSNDKYANQEVSFLLQRIEEYDGLIILASNLKNNIDNAFLRRFHSVIYFPLPDEDERLLLWQKSFPPNVSFAPDLNFKQIAAQYEMSGALIMNIVQHACLRAIARQSTQIEQRDIIEGIQREFFKQGKTL